MVEDGTSLKIYMQICEGALIDRAPTNFGGGGSSLVLLLKNALERVFVLGSKREDIRHFLLGFFARKKRSNTPTTKSIGVPSSFNSDTSQRGKFGICAILAH